MPSTKTSSVPLIVRRVPTSPQSYQPSWVAPSLFPEMGGQEAVGWLLAQPESPRGGYWMRSSSGFRSAVAVSLSSVLVQAALIPPRYYLSAMACRGILRRAAKRGKQLPTMLRMALEAVTGSGGTDAT